MKFNGKFISDLEVVLTPAPANKKKGEGKQKKTKTWRVNATANGKSIGHIKVWNGPIRSKGIPDGHSPQVMCGGYFKPKKGIGFDTLSDKSGEISLCRWYYKDDVERMQASGDLDHWIRDRTAVDFHDLICKCVHRLWPEGFHSESEGKIFKKYIENE